MNDRLHAGNPSLFVVTTAVKSITELDLKRAILPPIAAAMLREMFTSRRENGGGLCLACPIIQTVIFRPVKAKTISMPPSRNSLHLGRWESSSYLQTRSCGCE